jgi:hypothetical protein
LTTSKDSDALALSSKNPAPVSLIGLLSATLKILEKVFASPAAFPLLGALLLLDLMLPAPLRGILFLIGILGVAGVCGEEYTAWLRRRGLHVPVFLGLNGSLIPVLVAACWRPTAAFHKLLALHVSAGGSNEISLGLLTVITLGVVLCTLMVALALVAEVSEKLLSGLGVFSLACGGALLIGLVFAHLPLLEQDRPDLGLIALLVGWVGGFIACIKFSKSPLFLLARFAALGLTAMILFWINYP